MPPSVCRLGPEYGPPYPLGALVLQIHVVSCLFIHTIEYVAYVLLVYILPVDIFVVLLLVPCLGRTNGC